MNYIYLKYIIIAIIKEKFVKYKYFTGGGGQKYRF